METSAGLPPAIRALRDLGERLGREFVYPKEQALGLASCRPASPDDEGGDDDRRANPCGGHLIRLGSGGQETAVDREGKPTESSAPGASQRGENAPSSVNVPSGCGALKGCK